MARFCGNVGFAIQTETEPGVWEDVITEKTYFGNVVRDSRMLREGEDLHANLSVGNSISIIADGYANDHFFAIRYVVWSGVLWTVPEVEVLRPRLVLRLGEIYNGPIPG